MLMQPGCVAPLPDPAATRRVADVAGLPDPIAFHGVPIPLDAEQADPGAASGVDARRLTRLRALEVAVRHSASIQAALAEVRVALAAARQARLLSNPVLDLNVRFPEGGGDEVIEAGLSQPILDLLRRPARARAADARLRAAAEAAVAETLDVLRETEAAYAEAAAARSRVELLREQEDLLDRLVELAEARGAAGQGSSLDLLGFRARRAAQAARAVRVRAEDTRARLALTRLLGRPYAEPVFELDDLEADATALGSEAEHLRVALAVRPVIRSALLELEALGAEVKLAGFSPFDGLEAGVASETEGRSSLGPAIATPIPIFDFGGAARDLARAEVLAARHRLTDTARRVVGDVRQARAAASAADADTAALRDRVLPLQADRLERTRTAYRAGFADVTDVLSAQQDLLDTRLDLIEALLAGNRARSDLRRATGGVPDPNAPILPDLQPTTTEPINPETPTS